MWGRWATLAHCSRVRSVVIFSSRSSSAKTTPGTLMPGLYFLGILQVYLSTLSRGTLVWRLECFPLPFMKFPQNKLGVNYLNNFGVFASELKSNSNIENEPDGYRFRLFHDFHPMVGYRLYSDLLRVPLRIERFSPDFRLQL